MSVKEWDRKHLEDALRMAGKAHAHGFAPVGAILADRDGAVVSRDMAETEPSGDKSKTGFSLLHAELTMLLRVSNHLEAGYEESGLRFNPPYTLYVSLEPCHMCMGAAIVARIGRVVWALDDYWGGATKLYDSGRAYLQARMPELVRTPYPDLQARAAQMWVEHLNQYNLPDYIERMLRWQARLEES